MVVCAKQLHHSSTGIGIRREYLPTLYVFFYAIMAYPHLTKSIGAERWEIRTRPLGCQVSTITSLTSIISIVSTIVLFFIVTGLVIAIKRLRKYHQQQEPGWFMFWRHHIHRQEQEPLLGAQRRSNGDFRGNNGDRRREAPHPELTGGIIATSSPALIIGSSASSSSDSSGTST